MKGAFSKSLLRKISGSWGRFLAILGIVALGCGFFAGLNMVGRDMRLAGDAYYDDSALYDIRLVSTLGFTDRQMDKIRDTEGVEDMMPFFSCDAMVSLNNDEYTVRISSLPEGAAEGTSSMNKAELVNGAWPEADDECVMSADVSMRENLSIGDTVTVLYGTGDIDSVLTQKTFRVTGLVRSADYVDTSLLGTTTLGSGKIEQYLSCLMEPLQTIFPIRRSMSRSQEHAQKMPSRTSTQTSSIVSRRGSRTRRMTLPRTVWLK